MLVAMLGLGSLSSPALAQAPVQPEPSYEYATRPGDTLIGIGKRLLVQPGAWREVAQFNRVQNERRLVPGSVLRIPLRLLSSEALEASVEQVVGDVRGATLPLAAGDKLAEGSVVQTGEAGSAVVRLADGSVLRLAGSSLLQIEGARRYPGVAHVRAGVELRSGRVEVQTPKSPDGKPGFQVRTPQGVLGVRGTEFRVGADGASLTTRGEVLEGAVDVAGAGKARRLGAGFGTAVDATGKVAEPVRLLAAPDLRGLPALQERLVLRFVVPKLEGAVRWRGLVARDKQMREVLTDNVTEGNELPFTNLEDGDYVLRVRGIDARGLEGFDADHAFRLKARPEPPLPSAPSDKGITRGTGLEMQWTENADAATYRMQVAGDPGFAAPLRDLTGLATTTQALAGLVPGEYFWRLASVRASKDQGPWGSVRSFVMKPPPATPAPPAIGNKSVGFAWEGEPGQTFDFQMAGDRDFKKMLLERKLDAPGLELPRPDAGEYFVRFRARDPDGFLGPFTAAQRFEIINCVKSGDACVRSGSDTPLRMR